MQNGASSWSNPRVLLTFALIFICGALVGAIAVTVTVESPSVTQSAGRAELSRAITLANLTTELDLNQEQQVKLRKVLDDYFQYYHALQDQLDEVKASGQQRIIEILDEGQREKFRVLMEKAQQTGE